MDDLQVKDSVSLDGLINEVSKHIGVEWKSLARAMGFSQTDIDAIEYDNMLNLKEQICQLFHQWKQQVGVKATPKLLLEAIKKADLKDVIQVLLDHQYIVHKPSSAALATSLAAGARAGGAQRMASVGSISPQATSPSVVERDRIEKKVLSHSRPNPSPDSHQTELERIRQKRLEHLSSYSATNNLDTQESASVTEKDSTARISKPKDDSFEVGDCIKVSRSGGISQYGVIKWMGKLDLSGALLHAAGVEMEQEVEGGHDGTFNGNAYFSCDYGHGLLLPVNKLERDDRFNSPPEENSSPQRQPSLNQLNNPRNEASGLSSTPDTSTNSTSHTTDEMSPVQKLLDAFNELSSSNTPPVSRHRSSDSGASGQGFNQLVFYIPKDRTGLVVGKEGKNVQEVERETNTSINISTALNGNGMGVIKGSEENCKRALLLILTNLDRRISQQLATTETVTIPNRSMAGRVIGKNGANRKAIEALSGAKIKIVENEGLASFLSDERQCKVTGSAKQIELAKELIEDAMRGENIAGAAVVAALFVKLASHFREMGFEFPDDI